MRHYYLFIFSILLLFSACAGVDSQVNKSFKNTGNTIALKDLTSSNRMLTGAGSMLEDALEDTIARSIFIITQESPSYILKYKVLNYKKGSRLKRFSSFGLAKSAHGKLEVKVALYNEGKKVGAWTVDSWVKGGALGGNTGTLFQKVANEIMNHLRGNNDPF